MSYQTIIDSRVCGIPCKIGVLYFNSVKGRDCWDSDIDYYGYTECEWQILDQRGKPANWLERKMKPEDHEMVDAEVESFYLENDDYDDYDDY